MFETIGRNGRSSTFPFKESLYIFAVLWNFPGREPVGYNRLYSCSETLDLIFLRIKFAVISKDQGMITPGFEPHCV